MSESQGNEVQLYIYDLSLGLAQQLSELILGKLDSKSSITFFHNLSYILRYHFNAIFAGKKFDGIWHTSIVAFDREIYFGSSGIVHCRPVSNYKSLHGNN